jgi:GxxExxY protein
MDVANVKLAHPMPKLIDDWQAEREGLDELTRSIIGAAMEVHRALGPGLLESAYQACLAQAMARRCLIFERQKPLPIAFHGIEMAAAYRLDFVVERAVVVEIKAVDRVLAVHRAQVLSYVKLSGCKVGLLVNFHVRRLKDGIYRVVHHHPDRSAPLRPPLDGHRPSLRSRRILS